MINPISTPKDLANLVFKKLSGAKTNFAHPSIKVLNSLFETLFFTSIKTEEGQFIKVTITLIDPENPDPVPPERIVKDRWNCIYFKDKIPFTVKNLVKLSKAADPWSSSLAVYYDDHDELTIWGMIDQAVHYQSFLNYETEEGPEQPGLFQTTITAIGSLVVIFDYELIATLRQNILISNFIDVFRNGSVSKAISLNSESFKTSIKLYIDEKFSINEFDDWEGYIQNTINETLSRILLRIQNYQHGGALLITYDIESDLDIKFKITYDRLSLAITNLIKSVIANSDYSNKIWNDFIDANKKSIPVKLHIVEKTTDYEKIETRDELKGAIRFISSLSCIDGLVVMTPNMEVKGFGAVIRLKDLPKFVYASKTSIVHKEKLTPFSPNHFGTRHQSMFSYCWNNANSLGFVISQDGEIRAIMKVDDKLIMWENIKVQQFIKSNKLTRHINMVRTK
jgi:hypothetical protein